MFSQVGRVRSLFLICAFQDRLIPGLCDLHDLHDQQITFSGESRMLWSKVVTRGSRPPVYLFIHLD